MAARKRTWTPEIVRERIRTSMLLRRLHDQAFDKIEMSEKGLRAAIVLFERVVPKAEAVKQLEVSGKLTLEQLIAHAAAPPVPPDG